MLVFDYSKDGASGVAEIAPDGSGFTPITGSGLALAHPAWSPDGRHIAFGNPLDGGSRGIVVTNADGSNPIQITDGSQFDDNPAWSPDGTRIVFVRGDPPIGQIYTMSADGSEQALLSNPSENEHDPSWSPDGTKITFWGGPRGNGGIYAMNADGTNRIRLTVSDGATQLDSAPVWSPDGTKIVFESIRNANPEIYLMNSDGTEQTRLTHAEEPVKVNTSPTWSPDGTQIAFTSLVGVNYDIFIMNADGGNQTQTTHLGGQALSPAWGVLAPLGAGSPPVSVSKQSIPNPPTLDTADVPLAVDAESARNMLIQASLHVMTGADLALDGQLGPASSDAIRTYQRTNGLSVTGLLADSEFSLLVDQAAELTLATRCGIETVLRPNDYYSIGCLSGSWYFTEIKWDRWNALEAIASGNIEYKQCNPDCASDQTTISRPAELHLTAPGPGLCGDNTYTQATIIFLDTKETQTDEVAHDPFGTNGPCGD